MNRTALPWPGIALAVIGATALIIVTGDAVLGGALLLVWAASLFLARSEPAAAAPERTTDPAAREQIGDFLEPLGLPYLVIENGRIAIANRAAREVLGRHIIGQDARVALRHPEAIRLLDRSEGGEVVIKGLTGPRAIWHLSLRPIGESRSMVELVNRTIEADISRAHTDFVANASHELRTPLASIIGYLETLTDADEGKGIDKATRLRFLSTMTREARRLQALVEDLMSLSRIEAEKHDLPQTTFDVAKVVSQAVSDVRALHGSERVMLSDAIGRVAVRGDAAQINQLMRNLVDNAIKYGDPEKPVMVNLSATQTRCEIAVVDRGDGIPEEHIPHLTRRFYRTDPGRSRAVGGTGLGLAIVKHIVERHRGTLDIESAKGEGTTVTVRLPIRDEAAEI